MSRDYRINGHTVAQSPNPPLWAAIVGLVLSLVASDGSTFEHYTRALLYMGLTAWAYLELAEGVNAFRRALGAAGLIFVLVRLGEAIG